MTRDKPSNWWFPVRGDPWVHSLMSYLSHQQVVLTPSLGRNGLPAWSLVRVGPKAFEPDVQPASKIHPTDPWLSSTCYQRLTMRCLGGLVCGESEEAHEKYTQAHRKLRTRQWSLNGLSAGNHVILSGQILRKCGSLDQRLGFLRDRPTQSFGRIQGTWSIAKP